MYKRVCNLCGKEFDVWDEQQDFVISKDIGYGSKFDGSHMRLDMCCDCFDILMDAVIQKCVISPIEEEIHGY